MKESIQRQEDINTLLQRLVRKKEIDEKQTRDLLKDARAKEQAKAFGFGPKK